MSLLNVAVAIAAIYGVLVATLYFAQTWLLFPTAMVQAGQVPLPRSAQRIEIDVANGNRLLGVHLPGSRPEGHKVVLGFGGNAWNADTMAVYLHRLVPDRDVVAFHYRGYRPSTGQPSADALLDDSIEIYDHVQRLLTAQSIIAVGFSIGAGPAAYVARHRPLQGLILVTPFDSLEALAQDHYWWVPVGLLLRHRMLVIEYLRGLGTPTALIIAGHDTIVPARRSARLRDVVTNLVLDRTIAAGHNDLYDHPMFAEALREALAKISSAQGSR